MNARSTFLERISNELAGGWISPAVLKARRQEGLQPY